LHFNKKYKHGKWNICYNSRVKVLVKLEHELTPGTVGNFVGLAEGDLEIK
jgi:hypothetical protein